MTPRSLVCASAIAWILMTGCGGPDPSASDAAEGMRLLDSPVSSTGVHPVLNRGLDGVTRMLWSEPWNGNGARVFVSAFDGDGFGPARKVVQLADAFLNWADVPTLAATADGTLCVTWLEKTSGDTYAYGVRYALSHDNGASWSVGSSMTDGHDDPAPSAWLHTDRSDTEHGFVSTVALEDRFVAIWLDGRGVGGGGPQQLWSRSILQDGSLGKEMLVDDSVCDCCSTALMVELGSEPTVVAAWRDRSSEEVRDVHWARLTGETWEPHGAVHADHWVIPGCPVNGPRLGRVNRTNVCLWTSGDAREGAWAVPLAHGSVPAPIAINDRATLGRLGSAQLPSGAMLVSWLEQESESRAVWRLRTIAESGPGLISASEPWTLAPTTKSRSTGILRLVSLGDQPGDGVLAAWNEDEDGGILTALLDVR